MLCGRRGLLLEMATEREAFGLPDNISGQPQEWKIKVTQTVVDCEG